MAPTEYSLVMVEVKTQTLLLVQQRGQAVSVVAVVAIRMTSIVVLVVAAVLVLLEAMVGTQAAHKAETAVLVVTNQHGVARAQAQLITVAAAVAEPQARVERQQAGQVALVVVVQEQKVLVTAATHQQTRAAAVAVLAA